MLGPDSQVQPRSILFVPADKPGLAEKAAAGPADAICVDLEDAVPAKAKAKAREHVGAASKVIKSAGKQALVRVNSEVELIGADLAVLTKDVDGIILPKLRDENHAILVCEALDRLASPIGRRLALIAMVEDGSAASRLCSSTADVRHALWTGMAVGTEDLAADLGSTPGSPLIKHVFADIGLVAARRKLSFFGYPASIAEFGDLETFRAGSELGRAFGAIGAMAIHPNQVPILNAVFLPSDAERIFAERVIAAYEHAEKSGLGVTVVDGKMIDLPVVIQARNLLRLS